MIQILTYIIICFFEQEIFGECTWLKYWLTFASLSCTLVNGMSFSTSRVYIVVQVIVVPSSMRTVSLVIINVWGYQSNIGFKGVDSLYSLDVKNDTQNTLTLDSNLHGGHVTIQLRFTSKDFWQFAQAVYREFVCYMGRFLLPLIHSTCS